MILQFKDGRCKRATFAAESFYLGALSTVHDRFELSVASFRILKLKCLYGQVYFMTDLSERRLVKLSFPIVLLCLESLLE